MDGDEPPDDFVDLDDAAGAEFDAELDAGAGTVAVGFAAGVAVAEAAGAALLVEPEDELADAGAGAVSRFERDFLVVDAVLSLAAAELDAGAADFDVSAEASVDASAAFFERDFFVVVPLEASAVFEVSAEASVEAAAAFFERDFLVVETVEESAADFDVSAEASVESAAAFFERDFFVVPVDESELDAEVSPLASAVDFFFFDLEVPLVVPLAEESLELALESLDVSAAAFFFFFAFVVLVLESELELALLVSCALVAIAPTEISASTRPVLARAIRVLCHIVFMIVPLNVRNPFTAYRPCAKRNWRAAGNPRHAN